MFSDRFRYDLIPPDFWTLPRIQNFSSSLTFQRFDPRVGRQVKISVNYSLVIDVEVARMNE